MAKRVLIMPFTKNVGLIPVTSWTIWTPNHTKGSWVAQPETGVEVTNESKQIQKWASPVPALEWAIAHGYRVTSPMALKYSVGLWGGVKIEISLGDLNATKEQILEEIERMLRADHPILFPPINTHVKFGFNYVWNRRNYLWTWFEFVNNGKTLVLK